MLKYRPRALTGFTLIELLVVVAIVGILAAVSYPSYVEQVKRGKRSDAQAALLRAVQYLQRYYAANNGFAGAKLSGTSYATVPYGAASGTQTYNVAVAVGADNRSYTLTAVPNGSVFTDATCGNLTLDDTGKKGTSAGTVALCWR